MSKPKQLFLDCDSTLTDSVKAFCLAYNDLYYNFRGFKPANPDLVNDWSFKDQCNLLKSSKEIENIFSSWNFFEYLELFPNAYETLDVLKDKYEIIIVTIGTYENIAKKCTYLKEELPMISDFVGIVNNGMKMDKRIINMRGESDNVNIFIDDHADNLLSQQDTENLIRYCYGVKKPWNEKWIESGGRWLKDWNEIRNTLMDNNKRW